MKTKSTALAAGTASVALLLAGCGLGGGGETKGAGSASPSASSSSSASPSSSPSASEGASESPSESPSSTESPSEGSSQGSAEKTPSDARPAGPHSEKYSASAAQDLAERAGGGYAPLSAAQFKTSLTRKVTAWSKAGIEVSPKECSRFSDPEAVTSAREGFYSAAVNEKSRLAVTAKEGIDAKAAQKAMERLLAQCKTFTVSADGGSALVENDVTKTETDGGTNYTVQTTMTANSGADSGTLNQSQYIRFTDTGYYTIVSETAQVSSDAEALLKAVSSQGRSV